MDSNQMNGAANVACVKADITTRRSASTPASTVICAAATEVQNVVEEEEKTTGTTTLAKVTDTETQVLMIPIIGAIAIHPDMIGET